MDDLLMLEILQLKQQLEIAAYDFESLTGQKAKDYLHDLSTRDYFEETKNGCWNCRYRVDYNAKQCDVCINYSGWVERL